MDIKGDWKKRVVSGLMVLAMALSLLPTSILAADTRSVTDNAIKNGSFEQPAFDNMNAPQWAADLVLDWHTTASDQLIEFGSTRKDGTVPHIVGKPDIPDGKQFAFPTAAATVSTRWRSLSARSRTLTQPSRARMARTNSCR